jgi:hypothetical protein
MGMKKLQTEEGKAAPKSNAKAKLTPELLLQEIENAILDLKRVEQGELQPRQVEEIIKQGLGT